MIALLEKEIIRNWPTSITDHLLPSSRSWLEISGTNWKQGRVHFAILDQNGVPLLFVRMMRNPKNDCFLEEEYHLVESLRSSPNLAGHLPETCFLGNVKGQKFAVEKAVAGVSMIKRLPGRIWNPCRSFQAHIAAAESFLIALAKATKKCVGEKQFMRSIIEPLNDFYRRAGGETSDLKSLTQTLMQICNGSMETVVTHGDFSPKNLILKPNGSCVVIDWETATASGLPLIDLFYFLSRYAYIGGFSRQKDKARRIKALYGSSGSNAQRARQATERYCLRMNYEPDIIVPLFYFHFLFKAWLKSRMVGIDDKSTRFWLDLFHYYFKEGKRPWAL